MNLRTLTAERVGIAQGRAATQPIGAVKEQMAVVDHVTTHRVAQVEEALQDPKTIKIQ